MSERNTELTVVYIVLGLGALILINLFMNWGARAYVDALIKKVIHSGP